MLRLTLICAVALFGASAQDDTCSSPFGCFTNFGKALVDEFAKKDETFASVMNVGTAIYKAHQEVTEKKKRVDETVTISMPSDQYRTRGTTHYFGIEVTPTNKTAPWKVLHRYSDFRALRDILGPLTTSFVDAPFPSRGLMDLSNDEVADRRGALELWLQQVLDHPDSKEPWYEELRNFLESDTITKARNEVSVALLADKDYTENKTHHFGIVATPKDGRPSWTVHHRFSEFLDLKTSIGAEGDKFDNAPFPGKIWLMNQEKLDTRRKELEVWLQKVVAHPDSVTVWAPRVRDFLDVRFATRQKQTKTLVAERAKEREDEDLDELRVDASLDHLFEKMGGDIILEGVKETLVTSMERAVEICSADGGFLKDSKIKIPLPGELGAVVAAARKIGLGGIVDSFVGGILASMNDAASKSVPQTVGVFKDLIQKMKISDIKNLWMSKRKDACTRYLKRNSFEDMKKVMFKACQKTLEENDLMKTWADFVTEVKPIPILGAMIAGYNIVDYVVAKALDGLFIKMAIEEEKIRRDPAARTSDLMSQVFNMFR